MMLFVRSAFLAALVLVSIESNAFAQPPWPLLERTTGAPVQPRGLSVATMRQAFLRADARALAGDRIELTLFDEIRVVARRTSRSHPRAGSTIWHGTLETPYEGEVTLAAVNGVIAGSLTVDGRSFEIGFAGGGLHEVREVNPAAFPSEDFPLDAADLISASGSATSSSTSSTVDPAGQIDVMVVWTPAARMAAGGTTAAIQTVIDLAIANANTSYSRSDVPISLRLVYSGEVNFTETPSSISTDLSRLAGTTDGNIDNIHLLRNQYSADVVTLMGGGYAKAGYCGIGYLMSTVSTSFAGYAFNIVDQKCAAGNLSYAHEVGHNQGLHHDPANAGSTPSHPYAYGYQDPSGTFRTVMAYGSAARVQHLSNPYVYYSGKPTGSSTQYNAEALRRNASTVANFRTSGTGCSYAVTPTSLSFTETGGTVTVQVTTVSGCSWTTTNGASWITVGPGGSGSGLVTVTVAPNTGSKRSASIDVAGVGISITEAGAMTICTYGVTPTSAAIPSAGGSFTVDVTTSAGCSWGTASGASWVAVGNGGSGSGSATVVVSENTGSQRSATVTVAGVSVTVTQSAAAMACTFSVSPTSVSLSASGGTVTINVTAQAGCPWTARSNTGWIKVTGSGSGSGSATLKVHPTSGGSRVGTATVAGEIVTVSQAGAKK